MTDAETPADRHAFFRALAALPSEAGDEVETPVFPPGVAGKRRKPWLARQAVLARSLGTIVDLDDPHLPGLVDLWVASWAKTLPAIDFEARRGWLLDHLETETAEGVRVRVALSGTGEPLGFVMIDAATGYLDQIAVAPEVWGGGIAEALLREARRLSPAKIVLDVNADNPRAVAFYARQGFREIGRGVNPRSGLATLKLEWRADAPAA